MIIILFDKILKLCEICDVVEVSSGYARNFLIPKKKAMFASDDNLKYVESKKAELAAASAEEMANAQGKAEADSGAIDISTLGAVFRAHVLCLLGFGAVFALVIFC